MRVDPDIKIDPKIEADYLRAKEIREDQIRAETQRILAEIREEALRTIPPYWRLKVIRYQSIPGQLEEQTVEVDEKFDAKECMRFLQLMKYIQDPDYIKLLSECEDLSESSRYLIEKEMSFRAKVDQYKASLIHTALKKTGGNKKQAAEMLGMNRTTLQEIIKALAIEVPKEPEGMAWNIRRAQVLIKEIEKENAEPMEVKEVA